MILVADASFAAKIVIDEAESEMARRWWLAEDTTWVAPTLIGPEVESVIAIKHRNDGDRFPANWQRRASATWATMLDAIELRRVDRTLTDSAMRLVRDNGPLRGADSCYLAVALWVAEQIGNEVIFASFDQQQRRAARAAGIILTSTS